MILYCDGQMDICNSRVAFILFEKFLVNLLYNLMNCSYVNIGEGTSLFSRKKEFNLIKAFYETFYLLTRQTRRATHGPLSSRTLVLVSNSDPDTPLLLLSGEHPTTKTTLFLTKHYYISVSLGINFYPAIEIYLVEYLINFRSMYVHSTFLSKPLKTLNCVRDENHKGKWSNNTPLSYTKYNK